MLTDLSLNSAVRRTIWVSGWVRVISRHDWVHRGGPPIIYHSRLLAKDTFLEKSTIWVACMTGKTTHDVSYVDFWYSSTSISFNHSLLRQSKNGITQNDRKNRSPFKIKRSPYLWRPKTSRTSNFWSYKRNKPKLVSTKKFLLSLASHHKKQKAHPVQTQSWSKQLSSSYPSWVSFVHWHSQRLVLMRLCIFAIAAFVTIKRRNGSPTTHLLYKTKREDNHARNRIANSFKFWEANICCNKKPWSVWIACRHQPK